MKISCPGRIILMGEHGVVYGKPAIVAAVDRRMTVIFNEKNQTSEIKSDIPIGCGMGSSAALAVIRAAMHVSTRKKINEMAYEQEKINHGYPSGVDNTVCTYGGILWYQKIKDKPVFKKLKISHLPEFVLINTGKPVESTKEMIGIVKREEKKEKIFDEIEKVTKLFLDGHLIKKCLQKCERCLEELGVVGKTAKKIVREIEDLGGGAKISGAGGVKKGSGILLCYHEEPQKILDLAKKLKLEAFKVELGGEGVRIEC